MIHPIWQIYFKNPTYVKYLFLFFFYSRMRLSISLVLCLCLWIGSASIYDQYYDECAKITQAMTLEQKIGQTIQADFVAITQKQETDPSLITKYQLGSVLIAGNAAPTSDGNLAKLPSYLEEEKLKATYLQGSPENWKKLTDRVKNVGVSVTVENRKTYSIKLLLGTDAVHGDQHGVGNVLFPHNIGLSCSHNSDNFANLGFWTKEGMKKSGFNYAFAPTVAVSHNPQWGRFYETLGEEDDFIQSYASSFIKGLQDISNDKVNGVLGTAKHFFGDGSTHYGANEGSATVLSFAKYIDHNTQGYKGAVSEDVGSVMVSYSGINFIPNSYNSMFIGGQLRDKIGFKGFTISDYDEIVRTETMTLPRTFMNLTEEKGYALMVNAGVDMLMLSGTHNVLENQVEHVIKEAKKAITRELLFEERLDQAVTRILMVKMAMGLITSSNHQPQPEKTTIPSTSSGAEYADSLTAVHESLVLLKNSNTLPLTKLYSETKFVVLVGEVIKNINRLTKIQLFRNFDNIGMQCGGWSVRWQGFHGNDFWEATNKNSSNASSILDALQLIKEKNNFELIYPNYTTFTNEVQIETERRQYIEKLKSLKKSMNYHNTVILGAFGEDPYAQSEGDVNIPYCQATVDDDDLPYCLYNPFLNPYVAGSQPRTLQLAMSKFEKQVISEVQSADKNIPLVSVLFTGRPRLIQDIYQASDAVLAAWLPGTSGGQGVVDAIAGDYVLREGGVSNKKNSLSINWPRNMDSLKNFPIYGADGEIPKVADPLFPVGYGLSTQKANLREQ